MKLLTVKTENGVLKEYHSSLESASNRLAFLKKVLGVSQFEIKSVINTIETKETKQKTLRRYAEVE